MACFPDAICDIEDTQAWGRYGHKLIMAMRIILWCDLIGGANCSGANDVVSLASRAYCLAHLSESQLEGMEIQLMCQILSTGVVGPPGPPGPGGVQQLYVNAGDPNGVIFHNSALPAQCIDTVNHITWARFVEFPGNSDWTSP